MPAPGSTPNGFALVEAIIAALIVAAMMAVTFQTIANAAVVTRLVNERHGALLVAQSALASAESEGRFGERGNTGKTGHYIWQVTTSAYGRRSSSDAPPLRLLTAVVRDARTGQPLVTLRTLRLAL